MHPADHSTASQAGASPSIVQLTLRGITIEIHVKDPAQYAQAQRHAQSIVNRVKRGEIQWADGIALAARCSEYYSGNSYSLAAGVCKCATAIRAACRHALHGLRSSQHSASVLH
jgi:hypothetical protein